MASKPDLLNALRMAFEFLTTVPVPHKDEWNDLDFGWSAMFFPLAGAVIGLCAGFVFQLCAKFFMSPIAALLALILWILLSGGLHWDGLADCFDGFCCAATPERRLEIMKDSRLGTFGALGLFCSLILKWQSIAWLSPGNAPLLFALAGASARWAMLSLIRMPLVNPNGLAAMLQKHCPKQILVYAAVIPILTAVLYGGFGWIFLLLSFMVAELLGWIAKKKIGGINGDVLGLSIELTEILILLAAQVIS